MYMVIVILTNGSCKMERIAKGSFIEEEIHK